MGEVYRARDEKLNREVAIKVLPADIAQDEERLMRFKREAQVLASLNHPNIAAIYGFEDSHHTVALVMELVDGPTLTDRIASGAFSVEEALAIAKQIAEALEAAHERNIIHRDLKPANVKVTPEGLVKVLDFGLAKVLEGDPTPSELSHSPTLIKGTQAGVILGTAAYMSPEQAKGKTVDKRSDIWAFGCVLFEMLTGKQTFIGDSLTDTLAAVVRAEPDWNLIPNETPHAIQQLLRRCLNKDAKQRLRDIGEARIALNQTRGPEETTVVKARPQPILNRVLPWAIVLVLAAITLLTVLTSYLSHTPNTQPVLRSSLNQGGLILDQDNSSLALSPDGQRLLIAASSSQGKGQQLWLRSMDGLTIQSLPATTGATYPFWSPDSRYVGFFADRKLKKVEITTGTVQALCDAPEGRGASWNSNNVIVFAPAAFGPLLKISAAGGTPVQVTTVDQNDMSNRHPHFLPDGRRLLFYSGTLLRRATKGNGIYSLNLDTQKVELVTAENSEGIYVSPGYLVFVRDGNLMAQPLDNKTLHTTGQAVPIAGRVLFNPDRATGAYSLSDNGLLIFQDGSDIGKTQLTWFDAIAGNRLGSVGEPAGFVSVCISPDGKRTQTKVRGSDAHVSLWLYDLVRGIGTRLTSGPVDFSSLVWSPDGNQVAYTSNTSNEGASLLYLQPSDASSEPQKLPSELSVVIPGSWSANGEMIIFTTQTKQGGDLWVQPLNGDKKAYPFIVTPANEVAPTISPDGHWVAFTSDESGRYELYVTSFPSPGVKRQITSDGADSPQWLNRGRAIAYINAERKLKIVNVDGQGSKFDIGESGVLFGSKLLPALPHNPSDWDVPVYITADGKRVLLPVPVETNTTGSLTLVTNWTAALQK